MFHSRPPRRMHRFILANPYSLLVCSVMTRFTAHPQSSNQWSASSCVPCSASRRTGIARSIIARSTRLIQACEKSAKNGNVHLLNVVFNVAHQRLVLLSDGVNPSVFQIKTFLKELRKLLGLLSQYEDQESKTILDSYVANMEAMLATVRKDAGTADSMSKLIHLSLYVCSSRRTELPKAICDALYKLASEDDVPAISREILASLENIQATENPEHVNVKLDNTIQWRIGKKALRNYAS